MTKLTKNGRMTTKSRAVLKRPPWNAIVYAIGYPMASVIAVVSSA